MGTEEVDIYCNKKFVGKYLLSKEFQVYFGKTDSYDEIKNLEIIIVNLNKDRNIRISQLIVEGGNIVKEFKSGDKVGSIVWKK